MNTRRIEILELALDGLMHRLEAMKRENEEFRKSYGMASVTARRESADQPRLSLVKTKGGGV